MMVWWWLCSATKPLVACVIHWYLPNFVLIPFWVLTVLTSCFRPSFTAVGTGSCFVFFLLVLFLCLQWLWISLTEKIECKYTHIYSSKFLQPPQTGWVWYTLIHVPCENMWDISLSPLVAQFHPCFLGPMTPLQVPKPEVLYHII